MTGLFVGLPLALLTLALLAYAITVALGDRREARERREWLASRDRVAHRSHGTACRRRDRL